MESNGFYFPLFVNLQGSLVVLVGGGAVAARRATVLQRFGARVRVIAPVLHCSFEKVEHLARPYIPGDLEGAALAVAATDNRQVNYQVGEEARALHIPVSVADCAAECTFFFPAVCEGKNVLAGVVSRGEDHKLTAKVAKEIRLTMEGL